MCTNILDTMIRDTSLRPLDRDLGEFVNVLLGQAERVVVETAMGLEVALTVLEEEASIDGRDESGEVAVGQEAVLAILVALHGILMLDGPV